MPKIQPVNVKDTLFKVPEQSDKHLRLPPSVFRENGRRQKSFFRRFKPIILAMVAMELFWIVWNIFLFTGNLALFYRG